MPQSATIDDISFKYKGYQIPYGYYKFLIDFSLFTPSGKASAPKVLSLASYDLAKAEKYFSDAEALRRREILQQFANGEVREYYENSTLKSEELQKIVKQKRKEVVSEIVGDEQFAAPLDSKSENEYNDYGWARDNVLNEKEYADFNTKFADATASKRVKVPKTKSGELMIAVGVDGVNKKIVFCSGTIDEPKISRILEIDADNETDLSDIRRDIYEAERRSIQRETSRLCRFHYPIDSRYRQYLPEGNSNITTQNNNGLGVDRGTGSGATQKVVGEVQGPYLKVVETFTDITHRKRNVIKVGKNMYMIEGDSRSKYQPTIEDAIKAENERIIARYARKKDKTISFVKEKLAADNNYLVGVDFALPQYHCKSRKSKIWRHFLRYKLRG